MLLNFLLALVLFSGPGGAGSAMDPNGIVISDGVLLGDGILLSDGSSDPPPEEPPTSSVGWHIDPNGYSGCVDPNG